MAYRVTFTEVSSRRTLHRSDSPARIAGLLLVLASVTGCVSHNPWPSQTTFHVDQPAIPPQTLPPRQPAIEPPAEVQRVAHAYEPSAQEGSSPGDQLQGTFTELGGGKFFPALQGGMQNLSGPAFPRRTDGQGPIPWQNELGELAGLANAVNGQVSNAPLSNQRIEIALTAPPLAPDAVRAEQGLVRVSVRDTPLHSLLAAIAEQQGLSIVAPATIGTNVTVSLQPTTLENALDAIMAISNCTWSRTNDVIYVTPVDKELPQNFMVQGRVMKVFNLNYVSAKDVETVARGLLSPVGVAFSQESAADNKLKAIEQVVVEDLPAYVARIADYIEQADRPPMQAIVEVRILQVKLNKDNLHGVNLEQLARGAGPEVWLKTQTFSNANNPGAIFTVGGSHFNKVLDLLATTSDSKTLASPRLLMVNGQESRIQIGSRLAFSTSTTTQTTTVEAVQFLDVGTVLIVTPQIGDNGHILMKINPKVSKGEIDPVTQLPNEDTTELHTTIMIPDGHGVIIGGLIQEADIERQSKVPLLGDLWVVGRLFQRRTVNRERTEVVVALLPKIVNCEMNPSAQDLQDLHRVDMPLLTPDLQSAPRPEPSLPDAVRKSIWPKNAHARWR